MDRPDGPAGPLGGTWWRAYGVRRVLVMCHAYVMVDLIQMGEGRVGGADLRKLQAVGSSP